MIRDDRSPAECREELTAVRAQIAEAEQFVADGYGVPAEKERAEMWLIMARIHLHKLEYEELLFGLHPNQEYRAQVAPPAPKQHGE